MGNPSKCNLRILRCRARNVGFNGLPGAGAGMEVNHETDTLPDQNALPPAAGMRGLLPREAA